MTPRKEPDLSPGTTPILADIIGAWHPNPRTTPLNPNELTHVRTLAFACEWADGTIESERWVSAARFDIFHHTGPAYARPGLIIRRTSGIGTSWFVFKTTDRRNDLLSPDDFIAWSLLQAVDSGIRHHTAAARDAERRRLFQAFVQGRLRKRKRRGSNEYKVWVEGETA